MDLNRRKFLEFMGVGTGAFLASAYLSGCGHWPWSDKYLFNPLSPTDTDDLVLAKGFKYKKLISYGESINSKGLPFGYNNDYIALVPMAKNSGNGHIMWVNHEYIDSFLMGHGKRGAKKTKAQVLKEAEAVGGSLFEVALKDGQWTVVKSSKFNRRITALTKIPFSNGEKILGQSFATGTLANCAGGVTPWGTVLTCEENYDGFVGEVRFLENGNRELFFEKDGFGWQEFYKHPPEHYGWVVEVDPQTGKAQKHLGLGRFAHECATTIVSKSDQLVVYTGDDKDDEHLYKFISDSKDSLKSGRLFVANLELGRWIPLSIESDPKLKQKFKSQLELLIRTREAAKIVGATPLDRPEDIEIHPQTGDVFVALTNNKDKENYFGSLLRIKEKDGDHSAMEFQPSTFLAGGEETGFACPDNLAFDKNGNLWMTTDMSGSSMNKPPYSAFKNNSLFFIPMSGKGAGVAHRVASGPSMSELTGPCFSPDGKTLFLSVQHPGERSKDLKKPLSTWPGGPGTLPKPTVVAIDVTKATS